MTAHPLRDRVTVITGAGRGIGRAIATVFAEAGSAVVVATRGRAAGESIVSEITSAGGEAHLTVCDLADVSGCESAVADTIRTYGRLDILVHNAGVYPICLIEDMREDIIADTFNLNLTAAFWLARAALPYLRKSPSPRILCTSSVTGPRVALPGLAHYAASKAGLNGFIRAAALELARYRITVNGVEPGLIKTQGLDALGDAAQIEAMIAQIPLKRLGEAHEVAHAMLYLASDNAAFVTGQTIVVDGGALLPENSSALQGYS